MMDRQINAQTSTTDRGSGRQEPREAGALSRPASTFELSTQSSWRKHVEELWRNVPS